VLTGAGLPSADRLFSRLVDLKTFIAISTKRIFFLQKLQNVNKNSMNDQNEKQTDLPPKSRVE